MRGNHLVREMRKRAGLTQRELAERLGTTQSAIARLEGNVGLPTLDRLSRIAEACGLELQVRIVDADDHDWSMVARNARLTPQERIENALAMIDFAEEVRAAGERSRRSA